MRPCLTPSIGTLAAALGDGTALITTFYDSDLPYMDTALKTASPPTSVLTLNPKTITLRAHKKAHQRSPVRVARWSPDGKQLVLGIANGTIEVYEVTSPQGIWPRWCIPAQDSVITGIRWFSPSHICSLSIACVLRLRDMRNPVDSLEQNTESLSGCRAVDTIEPSVAIVGTECGTLRIIRLDTLDGIQVKQPVKRIYLDKNSVRDVQSSIDAIGETDAPYTLVYAGGAEGVVHECVLPRPIWPRRETCHLRRASILQKIRWSLPEGENGHRTNTEDSEHDKDNVGLDLFVGHQNHSTRTVIKTIKTGGFYDDEDSDGMNASECTSSKKFKRSRAPGPNGMDRETYDSVVPKFGEELINKTTVTRIAVSQDANLVGVGIDDGFLCWVPMESGEGKQLNLPRTKMPGYTPEVKKEGATRKRGRPRKNVLPVVRQRAPGETSDSVYEKLDIASCCEDNLSENDLVTVTPVRGEASAGERRQVARRTAKAGIAAGNDVAMGVDAGKTSNAGKQDDDDELIADLRRPGKKRKTGSDARENKNDCQAGSYWNAFEMGDAIPKKERLLAAVTGEVRRRGVSVHKTRMEQSEERQSEYVEKSSERTGAGESTNTNENGKAGVCNESNLAIVQIVQRNRDVSFNGRTNGKAEGTEQDKGIRPQAAFRSDQDGFIRETLANARTLSATAIGNATGANGPRAVDAPPKSTMSIPLRLQIKKPAKQKDGPAEHKRRNRAQAHANKTVGSPHVVTIPAQQADVAPGTPRASGDRGDEHGTGLNADRRVLLRLRLRRPTAREAGSVGTDRNEVIGKSGANEQQSDAIPTERTTSKSVPLRLRIRKRKADAMLRDATDAERKEPLGRPRDPGAANVQDGAGGGADGVGEAGLAGSGRAGGGGAELRGGDVAGAGRREMSGVDQRGKVRRAKVRKTANAADSSRADHIADNPSADAAERGVSDMDSEKQACTPGRPFRARKPSWRLRR